MLITLAKCDEEIIKGSRPLEVRLGDGGVRALPCALISCVVQQACDFCFAIKEVNCPGNHRHLWLLTALTGAAGGWVQEEPRAPSRLRPQPRKSCRIKLSENLKVNYLIKNNND